MLAAVLVDQTATLPPHASSQYVEPPARDLRLPVTSSGKALLRASAPDPGQSYSLVALLDALRDRLFTFALVFANLLVLWGLVIAPSNAYNDHEARSVGIGMALFVVWGSALGLRKRLFIVLTKHPWLLLASSALLGAGVLWLDGGWRSSYYLASYAPLNVACAIRGRAWPTACGIVLAAGYLTGLAINGYTVEGLKRLRDFDSVIANTGGYVIAGVALSLLVGQLLDFVANARRYATSNPATTLKRPEPLSLRDRFRQRGLTAKQCEVAELVARGLTNKQIAESLHIAVSTAETHVKHILAKLDVPRRAAIGHAAAEVGLLEPSEPADNDE